MASKKFKKSGAYIYSEETTLVRKSKEDGTIIGRMEDSTFVPFDKKTLELCKKHNSKYDADMAKKFEEEEEEDEEQQEEEEVEKEENAEEQQEENEEEGEEEEEKEEVKQPVKKEVVAVSKAPAKTATTVSLDGIMSSLQTYVNGLVMRNQELENLLKEREKELKASAEKMATLKKLFS